jgi:hypothetical protein
MVLHGPYRLPIHGWLGLIGLVGAEALLLLRVEVVGQWFYVFAWWPYILFADALVYRRKGTSLLRDHPREFALLLPWSLCFWLTFELLNLRLGNWHYIAVPESLLLRWSGYAASFATVLPGLFETTQVLEAYGVFRAAVSPRIITSKRWSLAFLVTGFLMLILPLAWPEHFFPLVWGCFTFLLEPLNYRLGGRSLLRQWHEGSLRTFFLLLTAGAICGILWEFWNYWAVTKWAYTIPHVGFLQIFEMPVLGFFGFPPFAVECYVMMNTVSLFRGKRSWEAPQPAKARSRPARNALAAILLLAYCFFVFRQIDLHTVATWRP